MAEMDGHERKSLRLRKPSLRETNAIPPKSNAQRCKEYREEIKRDSERFARKHEADIARYRSNYHRERTEEELQVRREKARLRAKLYRDRRKASGQTTLKEKTTVKTRRAKEEQREKWRLEKKEQRKQWSSQKLRRHREYCRRYYAAKKSTAIPAAGDLEDHASSVSVPQTTSEECCRPIMDPANEASLQKIIANSAIETLISPIKTSSTKYVTSPSPTKLKEAFKTRLEQLKRKRCKKSLELKNFLLSLHPNSGNAVKKDRTYKRKKIAQATTAVIDFFDDVAVHVPGKKSVSKKTKEQIKVLPKKMSHLHQEFCKKNPKLNISVRNMYRHLPKRIRTSRNQQYRQCLCEPCTNLDLKLDVLNCHLKEKSSKIDGRDALSEKSLCNPPSLSCIERKCKKCGTDAVRDELVLLIDDINKVVTWKAWEMVKTGHKTRRDLVKKTGTLGSLLHNLIAELSHFSKHLFVFRWQFHQFKLLKNTLPADWVLAVFDFSENYLCKYQNEVQSAHWGYNQVTVHPVVLHYVCNACPSIVTDYMVFLSDDLQHDAAMVKVITERTRQHLVEVLNTTLKKTVIFSDGCAAQYKSKLPFFHLANSTHETERCFYGSRHGKSACDACGGVVKRLADDDVLSGEVIIQSAQEMYDHLNGKYKLPYTPIPEGKCSHTKRSFHIIEKKHINRSVTSSMLSAIPGTRQLHSVQNVAKNILATRKLSCFCAPCKEDNAEVCENKDFVSPWEVVKLKDVPNVEESHEEEEHAEKEEHHADQETSNSVSRETYFHELSRSMQDCKTYDELEHLVINTIQTIASTYPLPSKLPETILDVSGTVDASALKLKPATAPSELYPILTEGDGNCFPRSFSTLIFGTEHRHLEVRCRLVMESVTNRHIFVHGLGMGENDSDRGHITSMLAILSDDSGLTIETVTTEDINQVFKDEVMAIRCPKSYMGLWQVAAAANHFGTVIRSIYPLKGWKIYHDLYDRTLYPAQSQAENLSILNIMWSSCRDIRDENWVANHVVPMLPISNLSTTVCVEDTSMDIINDAVVISDVHVNDFFLSEWNGNSYIARIAEIDENGETLLLNFMTEKKGLYSWPLQEDSSWEPISCLKKKVSLEFLMEKSSQRQQYYKIIMN